MSDASCHSGEGEPWRDRGHGEIPKQQSKVRGSATRECRGDTQKVSFVFRLS